MLWWTTWHFKGLSSRWLLNRSGQIMVNNSNSAPGFSFPPTPKYTIDTTTDDLDCKCVCYAIQTTAGLCCKVSSWWLYSNILFPEIQKRSLLRMPNMFQFKNNILCKKLWVKGICFPSTFCFLSRALLNSKLYSDHVLKSNGMHALQTVKEMLVGTSITVNGI